MVTYLELAASLFLIFGSIFAVRKRYSAEIYAIWFIFSFFFWIFGALHWLAGKHGKELTDALGPSFSKPLGFAPVKLLGSGLKAVRELAKDKAAERPLDELKEKLISTLRDLGHRFIITIDDVDRLEPQEVVEVLRLARSVADFPNVIYLLCYDSEILAHSIKEATGVKSGKVDVLFERLRGGAQEALDSAQRKNLLLAISSAMDEAYRIRTFDISWVSSLWDRAERLMPILLSSLRAKERQSALHAMFKDGKAVSWLGARQCPRSSPPSSKPRVFFWFIVRHLFSMML